MSLHATIECLGAREPDGRVIYRARCGVFAVEAEEPMRPLCLHLAYHGHSGLIEFYDVHGKHLLTFAALEEAARQA
jgi:hypothetical protein